MRMMMMVDRRVGSPASLAVLSVGRAPIHAARTIHPIEGPQTVLDGPAWREAARLSRERVLRLLGGSLDVDGQHPIYNFIFTYYSFDPKLLLRYSPGIGVRLTGIGVKEKELWTGRGFASARGGSGYMDPKLCKASMRRTCRRAAEVMRRTMTRPPHLNCYGLHEWAMLYQPAGSRCGLSRYQSLPLRVSQEALNTVVESVPIACTHFDAYRFFTKPAVPLNTIRPVPSRETQLLLEQPGCVHASMDLFRYSLKLWPWLPSELLADSLEVALASRALDMRASPYDVSQWDGKGFDLQPVCVETPEGRRVYQQEQSRLATRAQSVRSELLRTFEETIAVWDEDDDQ